MKWSENNRPMFVEEKSFSLMSMEWYGCKMITSSIKEQKKLERRKMNVDVREIIATENAPSALGPYSQAVKAGGVVYVSGQLGLDPATGDFVEGDVQAETRQVLQNLGAVLKEAGTSFEKVVKATVYVKDLADFALVNEVYAEFFTTNPPARACVEVARLPKDARVEIDLTALA